MPQVYATVYDNTHLLIFKKNKRGRFFWDEKEKTLKRASPVDLWGGEKYCFPGGALKPTDENEYMGAMREFREETGIEIPLDPEPFEVRIYNDKELKAACFFFKLPSTSSGKSSSSSSVPSTSLSPLEELYNKIKDQLGLANCPEWKDHWKEKKLEVLDNELATIKMISWNESPDIYFSSEEDPTTGWFYKFFGSLKLRIT